MKNDRRRFIFSYLFFESLGDKRKIFSRSGHNIQGQPLSI